MGEIISIQKKGFAGYREYKNALDTELNRAAESFVRIGYLLKVARDTDILKESGYNTVTEFAQAEYHLDKTQVSRFIHINDRFSENGYGDRLEERYREFGYAKLTLMLQLPDGINEELTPAFTKAEIQDIRDEVEEERKVSDIELLIEAAGQQPESVRPPEGNLLTKALWELGREQTELYKRLWAVGREGTDADIRDVLAPQGEAVYMPRIPGMGRLTLTVTETAVSVTVVRTQEKEKYTVADVSGAVRELFPAADRAEEAYRQLYGISLPEEPEKGKVAPVQPPKRKESKVIKAAEPPKPEEEQIPGQMDISRYEGVVPESHYGESAKNPEENGTVCMESETESVEGEAEYKENATESVENEKESGTEDTWTDIYADHAELAEYLTVWKSRKELMGRELLEKLYRLAVDMAAGFERLIGRTEDEQEIRTGKKT